MFPIALDLSKITVLLIGRGEVLRRRKAQLDQANATRVTVKDGNMPSAREIATHHVVMGAGLSHDESRALAQAARAAGKLVNIEDMNDLCDFYFTANVRRGDLVVAVSTSGASPTLARRVRDKIAGVFGEEWSARVKEIAGARTRWKAEGKSLSEVQEHTDAMLHEKGWL